MTSFNTATVSLTMSDSTRSNNDENDTSTFLPTKNNSSNSKQKSENITHSVLFRAMILFQIIAYGSYSILVHLCEKNGMIAFSSTTMNFAIELIKLLFSLNAFIYFKSINPNQIQILTLFKQSLPYSIPGILYFINNNLAVHIQLQMDPSSYQILANFKIFTTAILYRLIIKQKLSKQQWFALTLLFFGCFTYTLSTLKYPSFISNTTTNASIVTREMYIHPLGIPMITIYCILSGLAGVYNEWILKRNYSESLHLQNIFLYTYGTIFNLIPACSIALSTSEANDGIYNLFRGFSFYTWLIVLTQAFNGLFMSVVIKHSSNITRLFVISFSLIVTAILSFYIFHISFNSYFFISFATMICALSLYYKN